MSFKVDLMQSNNRVNDLNKSFTRLGSLDCVATGDISPVAMELKFEYTAFPLNSNYAYISIFNRYYFVKYVIRGNFVYANLKCDVLVSAHNDILNADIIADRSSSSYNPYIKDGYVIDLNKSTKSIARFKTPFETGETGAHYVLRVGGK